MPTVIHCVNPYLEPTTVWIHDQIRSLSRYSPIVYTRFPRNVEGFPVERLVDFTPTGVRGLFDRIATRIKGTYRGYGTQAIVDGADLIHAHFGQEGFRCLAARTEAGIPLVTTFYGLDVSALPKVPTWKQRFDRLFGEGDMFLAEGPHMASSLQAIGCPEQKIRVQPLAIDTEAIAYRPVSERSGSTVLMYASLREKKGHHYGVEAFARVAQSDPALTLTVIGDGPLREVLEAQVVSCGLEERVQFLGVLPHEQCRQHLISATVLLYPSLTAADGDTEGGAPVGILEALAAGLPVVSTLHADIPFVTGDGDAAWLVGEKDVDGLAVALSEALGDRERSGLKAERGRHLVEERHTIAALGRSLESYYDVVRK